jgi:two-component system chemotaxis response regulator CheB
MQTVIVPHSIAQAPGRRIRVMLVDDAIVVRGLFARWIEAEPDLELVASLRSGREAVNQIERVAPDVVVLDVEMPDMDGITALPLLLGKKRDLVVLMASTVTRRNAEISLRALSLGAADYIPKPATHYEINVASEFHRELIEKIRHLGLRALRRQGAVARPPAPVFKAAMASPPLAPAAHHAHSDIALRSMPLATPRALVIGSSTGGPQALNVVLTQITGVVECAPVLITQHMPPTFTAILAEHLTRATKRTVREAVEGEEVRAGTIYLAPGGRHMSLARRDASTVVIALDDGPVVNFCKPSVDPLFASAGAVWGGKALALMLTGMGHDGLDGARSLVAAGGHVIAQDEATSVVWGMPGQVAMAGLCSAVLPLNDIGPRLARLFAGERA